MKTYIRHQQHKNFKQIYKIAVCMFILISVCDHPGTVENGYIEISTDRMEAKYSCHTGYSLVGVESRVCQGDGQGWALEAPVCGKEVEK